MRARDLTEKDRARFFAKVVRGPAPGDCAIWVGAISEDGYGRFSIRRDGRQITVSAHRLAYAMAYDADLSTVPVVEHAVCDNPICVRASGDPLSDHLRASTQAANLARMGSRGRGGGAPLAYRWRSTDRASLAARSRRLRDAVKDGWDTDRIAAALQLDGQDSLF